MQDYSPPPPHITHPGITTRDVTKEFAAAVKSALRFLPWQTGTAAALAHHQHRWPSFAELEPGKIIKDDHFTLFEAVSALEVSV